MHFDVNIFMIPYLHQISGLEQKDFGAKFNIQVRKPNFNLRKALFKRGLERNCKKNALEFDLEKDGGIIFERKKILFINDYPFNDQLAFFGTNKVQI